MNQADAWSLAEWDAVETVARLRRREVSAVEVIDAAILRAESAGALNAIVTPTFARARAKAAAPSEGPLAGVPTFIKDLAQVAGVRTTWGTSASGDHVSRRSDPSVLALEATGLIPLGKSATPELGLTATTEPLAFGPCHNPWDLARSPGGSSGGAAALVASGVVPLAHGSDGGGSIRIPASCCGLVGLKPSRGRFDMEGSSLLPVNIAVHGVLTRTVRDTVAFWAALEAQLPKRTLPPIGAPASKSGKPLRIGVFVDPPLGTPVHPDVVAATERAAGLCADLGHDVQRIDCPFEAQPVRDFLRYWGFIAFSQEKAGRLLMTSRFDAKKLEPFTRDFARYFASELMNSIAALRRLRAFTGTYAQVMEKWDVLISPTLGELPPLLGHLKTDQPFKLVFERLISFTPFTGLINAAGAPAISLPLGRTAEGLPIGVQFASTHGREVVLLELALALEAASPWALMKPLAPAR